MPNPNRSATPCSLFSAIAVLCSLVAVGCDDPVNSFPPNRVFTARLEATQQTALEQPALETAQALEALFGTPDAPKWVQSDAATSLVSLENLARAAGAVRSDEEDRHFGLYREHCVACHGVSGDGLGPASRLLAPYPRDFRLGKFKYKSTPIGTKPTHGDLRRTLNEGLIGTSMPSFRLLKSDELDALVDYVIYLSVRGETERQLLSYAASELDSESGERLFDPSWIEQDEGQPAAGWQRIQKIALNVVAQWETAQSKTILAPQPPKDYPIFDAGEKLSGSKLADLEASIQRGRKLFAGPIANCVSCHGATGLGDGQKNNYDAWTKDWTEGLDPQNRDEIRPYLKLGALKPQFISPRNLRLGIYRGGSAPSDLYTRIVHGIEGTPMPAVAMLPENPQGLAETDVWDIVNFLLSLPHDQLSRDAGIEASVASSRIVTEAQ